jgi:ribosomal-protein-alanine N-acetyltransferase
MMLQIETKRLRLLPFTIKICEETLSGLTSALTGLDITPAIGWPDLETLDTLPRILINLNKVQSPSGFESWMVLDKSTNTLVGDIGFKGIPNERDEIDLGYGIVKSETQKGYAKEAALGLIEWAFKQTEVKAITANCSKDNLASQNILAFLNFKKLREHHAMIYWKLTFPVVS